MLGTGLALLIVAITLFCCYAKVKQSYWSSKGVKTPSFVPVFGHFLKFMSGDLGNWTIEVLNGFLCYLILLINLSLKAYICH